MCKVIFKNAEHSLNLMKLNLNCNYKIIIDCNVSLESLEVLSEDMEYFKNLREIYLDGIYY